MNPRPPEHGKVIATGKDGETVTYHYSCSEDTHLVGEGYDSKTKWCFEIVIEQELFQFDLVDEGSFMRVEMMNRHGYERYKARGIPEAFIRLSHRIVVLPVCSSKNPNTQSCSMRIGFVEEQHSRDATKVWKRLVASNEAYYDDKMQRFVYPTAHSHGSNVSPAVS
jgi:hypothetical protein